MLGYPFDLFDIEKTMLMENYFDQNFKEIPVFVCGSFTSEGDQNFLDIESVVEHGFDGRPLAQDVENSADMYDTPEPKDRIYVLKNSFYKQAAGIFVDQKLGEPLSGDSGVCIGWLIGVDYSHVRKLSIK